MSYAGKGLANFEIGYAVLRWLRCERTKHAGSVTEAGHKTVNLGLGDIYDGNFDFLSRA